VVNLTGDGKPDLAVVNNVGGTVSVLVNQGNGTFASKVDYIVGDSPVSIAAANLAGDGKPDLAVATSFPYGVVSVLVATCIP
jgi:hypothetical protein